MYLFVPQPFQVIYIALGTTLERDKTCDEGPQSSPTTGLDELSCKLPYRHTSLAEKCVFLPRRFLRNLSSTWSARGKRDRPRWVSGCSRQISDVFVQVDVSGCFPRSDTRAREKKLISGSSSNQLFHHTFSEESVLGNTDYGRSRH